MCVPDKKNPATVPLLAASAAVVTTTIRLRNLIASSAPLAVPSRRVTQLQELQPLLTASLPPEPLPHVLNVRLGLLSTAIPLKHLSIAPAGSIDEPAPAAAKTCPATASSSGGMRRRDAPAAGCKRQGYKRCPTPWSDWRRAGAECVDVMNDLESCGGCVLDSDDGHPSADGGRDCSAIPGVGSYFSLYVRL